MNALIQDVIYGLRMLGRNPGFCVIVVLILGIGIGATTAMLSVIDAVALQSCPYKNPETLASINETQTYVDSTTNTPATSHWNFTSPAGFRDWQEQNHVFEQMAGAYQWDGFVRAADTTERCRSYIVTPEFFSVLGVQPILGRTFVPEEYLQGGGHVAVLSHDHWRHWFGGDPDVIGKTLLFNREPYTVVGVLPESFRWIFQQVACGLWLPIPTEVANDTDRRNCGMRVLGRLKPGVSIAQAQSEMELINRRLAQAYPETNSDIGIQVASINEAYARFAGRYGKPRILAIVLAVAVAVLLIACLHVSSLLIARSAVREREIAVRAALGAHRLRLIRQLLTESVLLALLGGIVGILLAYWGLSLFSVLRGQSIPMFLGPGSDRLVPWFVDIQLNARCFLYVTILSLMTCGLFGLLPAIGISKTNLNRSLSAGRTSSLAPRFHRLRGMLVTLDIAIAFVLLIGAGLMINSYARILSIDPKVDTKNVLAAILEVQGGNERYTTPAQRFQFARTLMDRIEKLPGIESVAIANGTPAWTGLSPDKFTVEGHTEEVQIRCTPVSPDYFDLLRIPLVQGRSFTEHDNDTSYPAAIVSESVAKRLWPNENPLGKTLTHGQSERVTRQVVGVAKDVRHFGDVPDDDIYLPFLQTDGWLAMYPDVMIRVKTPTAGLITAVRREILAHDPDMFIRDISFLDQKIANLFSAERLNTSLLTIFSTLALILAAVGIYGATAYLVSRRTHEIGIRIALGAQSSDVLRAVLRQGLKLTIIGLILGTAGALATTRILHNLLHNVSPTDPVTFICVALLLAGITMLASYIPARRAARIDPMVALRYE